MKTLAILLFTFLIHLPSLSAQTKIDKIKELVTFINSGDLEERMISRMIIQYTSLMPDVPKEFWEEFSAETSTELIQLLAPIYEEHFTALEIEQLLEFYNSPLGQKLFKALPDISERSLEIANIVNKETRLKLQEKLTEQGHFKLE